MPIKKIHVTPSWTFSDEQDQQLDPYLFKLLKAIEAHGKLTSSARTVGISYRHAWNLLNKWQAFFGSPLVDLQKGRGTTLTDLGAKLVWAEKRVVARLEPQLESLVSDLNMEIQKAMEQFSPVLRLHASHGYAVALLARFADGFQLDLQYKNASNALAALNRGECDIAGFHLPVKLPESRLLELHSQFLNRNNHCIIRFISRTQGLMYSRSRGTPVTSLQNLVTADMSFINREQGAGTRVLFDDLLREAELEHHQIRGYSSEEFTHSAVAAYVAAGMADVGFGVEAAAAQFGLAFTPLAKESYLLVCHRDTLALDSTRYFLKMLKGEPFQSAVRQLPGYEPQHCGDIIDVQTLLEGCLADQGK